MSLRTIKKICLEEDNPDATYGRITAAARHLRRGRYSPRIYYAVFEHLRARDFVFDGDALTRELENKSLDCDFTYAELYSAADHVVLAISRALDGADCAVRRNALNSLRTVDLYDWEGVLAHCSAAEKYMLSRADRPFASSDETTKRAVRSRVSKLAAKRGITECEAAIEVLEEEINRYPLTPQIAYFAAFAFLCAGGWYLLRFSAGIGAFVSLCLVLPLSQAVKDLIDRLFSFVVPTAVLPKLELDGIPDDEATLVCITCLLTGGDGDAARFDDLEKYYLSNRGVNLMFGALCDLVDSDSETGADDDATVRYALERVRALNAKYGDVFALFIRRRVYSRGERRFIGRERKRGAIRDLVRLIKRYPNDFSVVEADRMLLHRIRHVITLDSDTRLYPGAVLDLVGAAIHPDNAPVVEDGRVVRGYGVLQPRMDASLESAHATGFTTMLCGSGGIDAYSGAAFDVYQSVFGEGSFCGKGIFSVDVYHELIDCAFPDESVLSHDLLEGEIMRCAALSDVVLCDSVPSNPDSFFKRLDRWSRGDVQALPFAGRRCVNEYGERVENKYGRISRFKIVDNVRRLLVPACAALAILLSMGYRGGADAFAVAAALSPVILRAVMYLPGAIRELPRRYASHTSTAAGHVLMNCFYDAAALFHTGFVCLRALVRAVYRMTVSRRGLLEWTVQETGDLLSNSSLSYLILKTLPGIVCGTLLFCYSLGAFHGIYGLLWVAMPFASFILAKPYDREVGGVDTRLIPEIKRYVRDHWSFYEKYVTAEDNHLPPDNVQFAPNEKIAHRTSPTNVGMYLLSVLAARDFGLITTEGLCVRLSETIAVVERMRKWRGHLYNWYDTRTLAVIGGEFVSTVDSGNLAASLIALGEGLKEYAGEEIAILNLISRIDALVAESDFSAFYNRRRRLFSIGYKTGRDPMKGTLPRFYS